MNWSRTEVTTSGVMNLYNVRQKFKNYSSPLPDLVWFIHHPECTREVSAIKNSLRIKMRSIDSLFLKHSTSAWNQMKKRIISKDEYKSQKPAHLYTRHEFIWFYSQLSAPLFVRFKKWGLWRPANKRNCRLLLLFLLYL